jgi:iron complex outermembrane receptor protein
LGIATTFYLCSYGVGFAADSWSGIMRVNIHPQSLGAALDTLARDGQFQLVYVSDELSQLKAHGVEGTMSVQQALEHLLSGTGMTYKFLDDNTVTIVRRIPDTSSTAPSALGATPPTVTGAEASRGVDSNDAIRDVIVTAQKREQRSEDIPISVSAIAGDELERSGASDFHDILLKVPGVSYSGTELGQTRYSIRGISTAASNPTVGIYLNDISLVTISTNFSGAVDPVLIDMERVEVLKGPQGTLYGGSALGGAIKYVTREPLVDVFSVVAEGGVASVDGGGVSYNTESSLNLPIVDERLAVRIAAAYRLDAGYVDNKPALVYENWTLSSTMPPAPFTPITATSRSTFGRDEANGRSTSIGRVSVKWNPSDSLSILPVITIQRSDKPDTDQFLTNQPDFVFSARFNEPTRDDLSVGSINISQEFPGISVTSLTGFVNRQVDFDRDYSILEATLSPVLGDTSSFNSSTTKTRTVSQELRVASGTSSDALKWTLGFYFSRQNDNLLQSINTPGSGAIFGVDTDIVYFGNETTFTSQEAVFGDATYMITRQWDLGVGLRWFDIRQKVDAGFNGIANGGASEVDGQRSTDVGVTPKITVTYRPLDDRLLYASAAKGFRAGGPNRFNTADPACAAAVEALGITHAPASYQPDNLWTYEVGSKNVAGERTTVINGAVYYTDWKRIQQQVNLNSCGFQFVGNVGAATVKGAELSAEFSVGFGIILGTAISFNATRITATATGVSAQVGQEVLDTPKWAGSVYGDYRVLETERWSGDIRADCEYHGSNLRAFNATASITYQNGMTSQIADPTQVQSAYSVVNLSVNFVNGPMRYRFYVNNLTNAAPYLDFIQAFGISEATTMRPRTVGIDVRTAF